MEVQTQTPNFLTPEAEIERNDAIFESLSLLTNQVINLSNRLKQYQPKTCPRQLDKDFDWQQRIF